MSANQHDWLSLVGISGLLVSEPVLLDRFPGGPPALGRDAERSFRREWNRWLASDPGDDGARRRWVAYILEDLLGHGRAFHKYPAIDERLSVELLEYEQKLWPDWVLVGEGGEPQMLVKLVGREQDLDRRETDTGRWRASPFTKLDRLLRETRVPIGLLTNGHAWRLVFAEAGLPTAYLDWTAQGWYDERSTLNAFRMLCGAERFDAETANNLITLVRESQDRQTDVADQLGDQVRAGLRALVRAVDVADRDAGGAILNGMSPGETYEMMLVLMMRLVFLLYAEENSLLPHGEVLYDEAYGMTYLWTRLQRQAYQDPESLRRTSDAWPQVLATFNMVYHGVEHPDFALPGYGGRLFDPDRFPALTHERLSVSNEVMYRVLHSLLLAEADLAGEKVLQRVSYRALNVEHLGYIYEGLLGYTLHHATETLVTYRGPAGRQEPLADLVAQTQTGDPEALYEYLKDVSEQHWQLKKQAAEAFFADPPPEGAELYEWLQPFEQIVDREEIYGAGDLVVVEEPGLRRRTGTHYTPTTLTAPIVQHTLEPQVYVGPAEGLPREEWTLRTVPELLSLKVCDMAMGSGAFLVQACRYLAGQVVEAWAIAEYQHGENVTLTAAGAPATGEPGEVILPRDNDERVLLARRLVADHCLYGVDKNPLAVEVAKLSLWLVTLDRRKPFTFLDHALKTGDSLVGVSLEQLQHWSLDTSGTAALFAGRIRRQIDEVVALRRQIAGIPVNTIEDQERKAWLLTQADTRTHDLRQAATMLVWTYFNDLNATEQQRLRDQILQVYQEGGDIPPVLVQAANFDLQPFHWELEFPEVFIEKGGGFHAFVGNPPFVGGLRISSRHGGDYLSYLQLAYPHAGGTADIVSYFFMQAYNMLRSQGSVGLIATNTIAQGDTRAAALQPITDTGGTIYRAERNRIWPGVAAVVVSTVNIYKGRYHGQCILDNSPVPKINDMLDDLPDLGEPYQLTANNELSFIGSLVVGKGYVLEPDLAHRLIESEPRNAEVLFPYLRGEDFNQRPDQSPSRWVINFFDWSLEKAEQYGDVLNILKRDVKPYRDKNNRTNYRKLWWIHGERRPGLYTAIAPLERVLFHAFTSKYVAFGFVPSNIVYAAPHIVFALDQWGHFTVLQSSHHQVWVRKYASTLGADTLRYAPSDVFQTFACPFNISSLDNMGELYHETRRQIMLDRWEGLTDTYNRFHDPDEHAEDIAHLRELHVEMDYAVAATYGWDDLDLGHGFHETQQGVRYTINDAARREVLTRLLKLNHERYVEEVRQGLHGEKAKKELAKRQQNEDQMPLF